MVVLPIPPLLLQTVTVNALGVLSIFVLIRAMVSSMFSGVIAMQVVAGKMVLPCFLNNWMCELLVIIPHWDAVSP